MTGKDEVWEASGDYLGEQSLMTHRRSHLHGPLSLPGGFKVVIKASSDLVCRP
jgi:hypothetical protein